MRILALLFIIIFPSLVYAQRGNVIIALSENSTYPVENAYVEVSNHTNYNIAISSDSLGKAVVVGIPFGKYYISVRHSAYKHAVDSFYINSPDSLLIPIKLKTASHWLDEFVLTEKLLRTVQHGDTTEFNAGPMKLSPNADGADLVSRIPGLQIDRSGITAQGQNVYKILVDGKPFFTSDPLTTLHTLPAEIIEKIQIFNDKSEAEKFTGFKESSRNKTINIITDPNKRKGYFGNATGGLGSSGAPPMRYSGGVTLNQFNNEQRITITGSSNNINNSNFSENTTGNEGITTTSEVGLNYSDNPDKHSEFSLSYLLRYTDKTNEHTLQRNYILPNMSRQAYVENSPSFNTNTSHRVNAQYEYRIDTNTSLLVIPQLSFQLLHNKFTRLGRTLNDSTLLNKTDNDNNNKQYNYDIGSTVSLRHKLKKPGRTLSLSTTFSNINSNNRNILLAQNNYYNSPQLNDTINQRTEQIQASWNIAGDVTYTEPLGKNALFKMQYTYLTSPTTTTKSADNFNYVLKNYSLPDTNLSNSFYNNNTSYRGEASLQVNKKNFDFTLSGSLQHSVLHYTQTLPNSGEIWKRFTNLLPNIAFNYNISPSRYLQFNYSSVAMAPPANLLQDVVNNADPLHLTSGNPNLKQSFQDQYNLRYTSSSKNGKQHLAFNLSAYFTDNTITNYSFIPLRDTVLRGRIILPAGSEYSYPINIDGYYNLSSYINYYINLTKLKTGLDVTINTGTSQTPSVINNATNYQINNVLGGSVISNSNITDRIDLQMQLSSNLQVTENSFNKKQNNTYLTSVAKAAISIIPAKRVAIHSVLFYQTNQGLTTTFNQNYFLWNIAISHRLFKDQQGEIKASIFDILNQNKNIVHTVTDSYIEDARTNIIKRYFMVTFTYKFRNFHQ